MARQFAARIDCYRGLRGERSWDIFGASERARGEHAMTIRVRENDISNARKSPREKSDGARRGVLARPRFAPRINPLFKTRAPVSRIAF
jgi:hypothetical protein